MAGTPRTAERSREVTAVAEERVAVLAARPVLEEVAAHELLRERRAALGEAQPEPAPPFHQAASECTAVFWTTRGSAR